MHRFTQDLKQYLLNHLGTIYHISLEEVQLALVFFQPCFFRFKPICQLPFKIQESLDLKILCIFISNVRKLPTYLFFTFKISIVNS